MVRTSAFPHVAEGEIEHSRLKNCSIVAREGRLPTSALTILIADRHEDLLNTLKRTTDGDHYAVLHARNEEEATVLLERAKSKIQIAIVDRPDFSEWDLTARLTLHNQKPIKIVATTTTPPDESDGNTNPNGWKIKLFVTTGNRSVVQIKSAHFI
jgi:CheY-like chemotaxis protein